MATIKTYTDLSQSKILSKILPLESADMWYHGHGSPWESERVYDSDACPFHSMSPNWDKPCWSLAALMGILPEYNLQRTDWGNKTEYKIVVTTDEDNYASKNYDNPVDACYEMIIKLNELKML